MKIGLIGNTKLTLKGLRALIEAGYNVRYLFGLPPEAMDRKVNAVDLSTECAIYNIKLDKSGKWQNLENQDLDTLVALGDSRIVPESVLLKFRTIGNHGGVLPIVQGGASLVWGRMLNTGEWGISIMELHKIVDRGRILATKTFSYDYDCSMEKFVEAADNLTVEALLEVLGGAFNIVENEKWHVKIAKHADSQSAINIVENCIKNKMNVYLPPRTPQDSLVELGWSEGFKTAFKHANNTPYPIWREKCC